MMNECFFKFLAECSFVTSKVTGLLYFAMQMSGKCFFVHTV